MEWISVEDKLPEIDEYGTRVIGASIRKGSCNFIGELTYSSNKYAATEKGKAPRFERCGRISPWSITHWMPLPPPPEGK